jgi:hypothetical protein
LDQPLDFSDIREQLWGTNLTVNPTNPILTPAAGGSGIPPSPPPSSPSSSGKDSSDEGSSPSQPSTPTTPMANQNNPTRPWLNQDAVAVPGDQHPLPKHPKKWLPKFDPNSKQITEDHINTEVEPSTLKIIQLDRTNVKVVGELRNVLIRLSSNPKVHQVIDIIVVDIPEVYGIFLSKDWSEQLHGYFVTNWSHLWLL